MDYYHQTGHTIQFCIIGGNPPAVIRCVEICFDLSWQAYIFGQQLLKTNTIIKELPSTICSEKCLQQVLSTIHKANLCPGSAEDHFVQLLETGEVKGIIDLVR